MIMITITLPSEFKTVELDTRSMNRNVLDLLLQRESLSEQMRELDKNILVYKKKKWDDKK